MPHRKPAAGQDLLLSHRSADSTPLIASGAATWSGIRWLLLALAAGATAACGGGDGSDNRSTGRGLAGSGSQSICRVVGGGGSSVSATAVPPSSIDNANAAFDGDLSTSAPLSYTVTGSGNIKGTLQAGTVVPGGGSVGVAFDTPANGAVNIVITTYLQGVPQDVGLSAEYVSDLASSDGSLCTAGSCSLTRNGLSYVGVLSVLPFDSIEAVITVAGDGSALNVRELCVR